MSTSGPRSLSARKQDSGCNSDSRGFVENTDVDMPLTFVGELLARPREGYLDADNSRPFTQEPGTRIANPYRSASNRVRGAKLVKRLA